MRLYNTMTQQKETFTPTGDHVTMYVCGITPYDTTHLGHAFTYVVFDTLARYFQFKGWPVRYAQNVTDIDDDILRKAKEVGENWKTLGDRWTRRFIEDMDALNALRPTYYPRATEEIAKIIEMTRVLLDKGYAYEKDGAVYFQVDNCLRFGQLSRIPRDEMLSIANERGNIPDDPNKRDPLDFVLWQAAKPGEPAWDSPLGNLVMARDLLQTYSPDAVRAYLLSHHYRTPWEDDEAGLRQAAIRVERYTAASHADAVGGGNPLDAAPYRDRFVTAMDDDLDTPAALSALGDLADAILAAAGGQDLVAAQGILRQLTGVMGLRLQRSV
ncbi:MAG: class I tRNA ligase family protein [Anaerolineae bacterium]